MKRNTKNPPEWKKKEEKTTDVDLETAEVETEGSSNDVTLPNNQFCL